ncbi:hypothetical protein KAR91_86975 [Candidatus Pacearchaeota archaeon]|nr:hypothetical protein [Candidatus Pacearchaeota archaeon]
MATKVKSEVTASNRLMTELTKIHPQWELPAAIFLSLRGRFERKRVAKDELMLKNRIGKVFADGDVGVVMLGDRGTRKTTIMKTIFHGLGLDGADVVQDNEPIAHFVKSAGMATSIGLFEMLADHPDTIIFLDEMDWDNPGHFGIFKQISNGEIMRQKHGQTEPTKFKSLVVAATNSISMPSKKNDRQHLLAVLDRFYVLVARPVQTNVHDIIDDVIEFDFNGQEVDWGYLRECLTRENFDPITEREKALVHAIWEEKERFILGGNRDQTRNVFKIIDTVLFFKRLLGVKDITEHEDIVAMVNQLVDAVIMFNPASVISLKDDLDELLYSAVADNDAGNGGVRMARILEVCKEYGISVNESERRKIINRLDNLVMSSLLVRPSKGKYSVKKPFVKRAEAPKEEIRASPLAGAL